MLVELWSTKSKHAYLFHLQAKLKQYLKMKLTELLKKQKMLMMRTLMQKLLMVRALMLKLLLWMHKLLMTRILLS